MKQCKLQLFTALIVLCALLGHHASGAFCALRDPVSSIGKLYPDSNSFRSVIKSIGSEVRAEVGKRLPFSLHFNELGRHTLYVPVKAQRPLGLVHVRSELLNWGLVEIAWGMDLNLNVTRMTIQRCRSRICTAEFEAFVRNEVIGKSFDEMKSLLDRATDATQFSHLGAEQRILLQAAIRSALKTLIVTEVGWEPEIATLRNENTVIGALGAQSAPFKLVRKSVSDDAKRQIQAILNGQTIVNTDSIEVFAIERENSRPARLVVAAWENSPYAQTFSWVISEDEHVLAITPISVWPDQEVQHAFESLIGLKLDSKENCGSAAELAGFELTYLSRHAMAGPRPGI